MERNEREIPRYVLEDLLFERRLCRSLNMEQERLNALLSEHIKLLEARRQLMSKVHAAVQERWEKEEAASNIHSAPEAEANGDAD